MLEFDFEAELFLWQDDASWHFISLPAELADVVREASRGARGGFGSVKVAVRVGASEWSTSLFPDKSRGSYLLPVKADVRRAEGLAAGDQVAVSLRLQGA